MVTAEAVTTEIDNDGDGKADQYSTKGTAGEDAVTAAVGDKVDVLDTGAGDDIISAGNGADVIFGGAGDDFIFGGANMGVDDNGNQDKDRAVFEGNYLTGTDANGEAVAADLTVTKKGIIAQLSCDPGTGEVCLLTLNDAKDGFVELKDSAINATATPTVFADVRDVYVASVASTSIYNADTNPDGSKVNSSVKTDTNSAAVNLVSDTVGGAPKTFSSGESTDGFDTGSMTLVKAHEMVFEDTNGTTILAKDAAGAFVTEGGQVKEFADANAVSTYATDNSLTLTSAKASKLVTYQDSIGEELDVYEVKKGTEVDTVAGIEQLEFSDTDHRSES